VEIYFAEATTGNPHKNITSLEFSDSTQTLVMQRLIRRHLALKRYARSEQQFFP